MMSLGLLLDGVLAHVQFGKPCYQYKLIYGLFIVAIVTGFLSVLGLAIERFQVGIDSSQPNMSRRTPYPRRSPCTGTTAELPASST